MRESRLHRWSRQKAEASEQQDQAEAEQPDPIPSTDDGSNAIGDHENDQTAETKPVELPPIESLGDESDYSMFMTDEVEESIRKLALRKLFKAPFFNIRDGLNDYDEDFTTFAELGDIVTSDMKFHAERKKAELEQKQREEAAAQAAQQSEETGETDTAAEVEAMDDAQPDETADETELAQQTELPDNPEDTVT